MLIHESGLETGVSRGRGRKQLLTERLPVSLSKQEQDLAPLLCCIVKIFLFLIDLALSPNRMDIPMSLYSSKDEHQKLVGFSFQEIYFDAIFMFYNHCLL